MSRISQQLAAALVATSAIVVSTSMANAAFLPPRPMINIVVPRPNIVMPVRPNVIVPVRTNVVVPAKVAVVMPTRVTPVAAPKPTSVTTAMFAGKEVTKTTYIKGNEDTVIFTNQSGKVVGAISSISEPVSPGQPITTPAKVGNAGVTQPYNKYPNVGITPANAWVAGVTQPYNQYPNAGITPANAWNAGVTQPYNQYPNAGITPANAWNAGASQPYNQYKNVISP